MADSTDPLDPASNAAAEPERPAGLDGVAVAALLRGAALKRQDPHDLLRKAAIDPSVHGDPHRSIDGRELFRLVQQIQLALDDAYIGFLAERCRLALEMERTLAHLHCETFGESLRVSIRFTQALSAEIGPQLVEDRAVVKHVCVYHTIDGVDRDIFVWLRFVWIFHLFSWLIGRPLRLRGVYVRGPRPVQANGFDRFALFGCPIHYNAPIDALCYDRKDLGARLVHGTLAEYRDHEASNPDWFATPSGGLTWRARTEHALVDFQRSETWSPSIETIAGRLRSQPRRLRRDLAREGESFQQIRTRLRGELAAAYLLVTDLPITMVGYRVGFSEPGSFTRNFVEWAGMTPSDYRARYKSENARVTAATMLLTERTNS
ncbi:AraC family transcriptional regulator [Sphingomonas sp.]|uniref:AraC family transcriptional regulator n=1 Tax=Sphingomonas sp. TaxID=28214 RepID=UPI001B0E9400|nr:AraC family transcriptional regulator [Sphingomonas sp.]MBO9711766.1 AraC family transcriptional regulator ligand-binding domain-containing protein [Sphingomonas sp.]